MNPNVKILSEKTIYKGWSVLKEYVLDFIRKDGIHEKHIREIYDSGDGAAILLYNPDEKKIILVRQFRLAAFLNGHPDGMMIEICAGMLDKNSPEKTITKEVEEETGLKLSSVTKVFEAFATPGAHKEKIHFYIGRYDKSMKVHNGGGLATEHEEIEILELDYADTDRLLLSGELMDIKTIAMLQYGKLHNLF